MILDKIFWSRVMSLGFKNILLFAKAEVKIIVIIYALFALGFWLLGYEWAWLIALGISIVDILPILGSGIVFIPWVIIEWVFGDPSQGWWLLLLYVGVEIIQQLIEPFFLGKDLELPFWMPLVIMIGCTIVFNIFGIIVASILIPFIAAYRRVYREYTMLH